jgi:nicotinamide mononucleotide adenylyltransferase
MAEGYFIYPGRFQPPHNDHVVAIRRALDICGDPFFLGLIVHAPASDSAPSQFEREARLQNSRERNPFPFYRRLRLLEAVLGEELPPEERLRVRIIALPRPEAFWDWICALFPDARRHWVVPQCGEAFDDMKAEFFAGKGDTVVRVAYNSSTDGRLVRDLIAQGSPELQRHVPAAVTRSLQAWGILPEEPQP